MNNDTNYTEQKVTLGSQESQSGDDTTNDGGGRPAGEAVEAIDSFDEMGLPMELLRGIYAYGFERPSAIQQRAIEPIVAGRDVIAQSQSGTGKTAVFCIGMLQVRSSLAPLFRKSRL